MLPCHGLLGLRTCRFSLTLVLLRPSIVAMPISIACSCGAKLRAPDAAAGKTVACPKCKARVSVPSERVSPAREPDAPSVRQSGTLEASNEALKATDYPK